MSLTLGVAPVNLPQVSTHWLAPVLLRTLLTANVMMRDQAYCHLADYEPYVCLVVGSFCEH